MYNKNPLEILGTTQEDNRNWWEENPMTYSTWGETITEFTEDDPRFYRKIDSMFFTAAKHFAHPGEKLIPFSRLIDFESLRGKRVLEIGCGQGSSGQICPKSVPEGDA